MVWLSACEKSDEDTERVETPIKKIHQNDAMERLFR